MCSDEIVIDVRNLTKRYEIYATPRDRLKQLIFPPLQKIADRIYSIFGASKHQDPPCYFREFHALNDISFQVCRGKTLGIIGRNGSGKSTLLQIIAGTLAPTSGEVNVNGRVAALLELGSGFNPEFTGRENVFLNGQILGLTQKEVESRYEQIIEFADIGEFINQPVKTYSSGMFVRLAFAVQAHIDASIVIIDEALAVGDIFFRQKCYARLEALRASGAAIILVSHSMGDIEQHCDSSILLDHGNIICFGPSAEAIKEYYLLEQVSRLLDASSDADVTQLAASESTLQFPEPALIHIEGLRQINALGARCLRLALTGVDRQPRRSFRFGETAVFHHEHYFGSHLGVPVGGIIIHTEKGVIIHGKSSLQARMPVDCPAQPGSVVRFEHRVTLSIAPGEYTFDIGMSAVDIEMFNAIEQLTREEADMRKIHLVQLPKAGSFTVLPKDPDRSRMAEFHGLIDLPSEIRVSVFSDSSLVAGS